MVPYPLPFLKELPNILKPCKHSNMKEIMLTHIIMNELLSFFELNTLIICYSQLNFFCPWQMASMIDW